MKERSGKQQSSKQETTSASERLVDQGRILAGDLAELKELAAELLSEKLDAAKSGARDVLADKKRDLKSAEDSLAAYVREKPLKSLALAVGAGVLLNMLFSRK